MAGSMQGSAGDYIVRGIAGEHYACKPDIFEKTYAPEATFSTPSGGCDLTNVADAG